MRDFAEIKSLVAHFEERKSRAKKRSQSVPGQQWNFAITGLQCDFDHYACDQLYDFRRVVEPPGEVELACALKNKRIFSAIGRHSQAISYELAVDVSFSTHAACNFGWEFISALRVKTLAEFLVPAVADRSWSIISALNSECEARLLEDFPLARRLEEPITVHEHDLIWVTENFLLFSQMLDIPKFRLAVESLTTCQHLGNLRAILSSLWSGIESLVGVQTELRYRIAVSLASILEPRGPARTAVYTKLKKLYDVRSQAVHGSAASEAKLLNAISQSRKLLSDTICTMVEKGRVFSEKDFEEAIME